MRVHPSFSLWRVGTSPTEGKGIWEHLGPNYRQRVIRSTDEGSYISSSFNLIFI